MPHASRWLLVGALASWILPGTSAFYLPGAAPHDYRAGESVKLLVNALTPMLAGTDNAKIVRQACDVQSAASDGSCPEIYDQL